jgi:hypothetical protein
MALISQLRGHWVAVVLAAAWTLVVMVSVVMPRAASGVTTMCAFKRVTGVPCATCGSTRAVGALAAGDVVGALMLNPWVTVVMVGVPVWMAARRTRESVWAWTHARAVWVVMGVGLAVNWAYVVMVDR